MPKGNYNHTIFGKPRALIVDNEDRDEDCWAEINREAAVYYTTKKWDIGYRDKRSSGRWLNV